MSFIVYVDNFSPYIVDKFEPNPRRSISTGIRLAVHEEGTTPDFSTGVSAGPGTETSITVTPESRKRLDVPYNGCNNDAQQRNGNASYSASSCVDECLQDMVRVHNIRHYFISYSIPI